MKKTESEDHPVSPWTEVLHDDVLDRYIRDGERDRRFNDRRRQGEDAGDTERQRDRVRDGEGGDLQENRPKLATDKEDAQHEEHVIEALGQDVGEAKEHVLADQ